MPNFIKKMLSCHLVVTGGKKNIAKLTDSLLQLLHAIELKSTDQEAT
jgi:hypothetical protein